MIKGIKFNDDYICFFENQKFELKPITLLVGDQGCGKSTLLKVIKSISESIERKEEIGYIDYTSTKSVIDGFLFLDLEKDNPAIQQGDPTDSDDMLQKLTSRFESHGETLFPILEYLKTVENKLIILDEPETALSLRSQFKMVEIFKECVKNGCQVVLATHNYEFIKSFPDNVLNLETSNYVTPEEFLESQKEESDFKNKRENKIIKSQKCRLGTECECTKESSFYDRRCIHYVDREGNSGYDRGGQGPNRGMKEGDFKNG